MISTTTYYEYACKDVRCPLPRYRLRIRPTSFVVNCFNNSPIHLHLFSHLLHMRKHSFVQISPCNYTAITYKHIHSTLVFIASTSTAHESSKTRSTYSHPSIYLSVHFESPGLRTTTITQRIGNFKPNFLFFLNQRQFIRKPCRAPLSILFDRCT